VLRVTSLALTRRVLLDPLELSVLKLLVARRTAHPDAALVPEDADATSVAEALEGVGLELDATARAARCA
jgi:hypothetical protein